MLLVCTPFPAPPSHHLLNHNRRHRPPEPKPPTVPMMTSSSSSSSSSSTPKRILIAGGGVIGACTAYFLSQTQKSNYQITLIEKSSIAAAASGKSGGFLALDWCDSSPLSALARPSFLLHRSLSYLLDGPHNYGYRPLDTLSISVNPSPKAKKGQKSGLPAWVDGSTTGLPKTIGTVETTAQVHPKLFTRTMIEVAEKNGVEVVIGEEVERVELEGGKVVGAVVVGKDRERRMVEADVVVLTMGPWSGKVEVLANLFRVSGLKAHSIVIRPVVGDVPEITAHALFLSYQDSPGAKMLDPEVYPRPTGEVYICGMSRDTEVPNDPEEIEGDPASIEMLHKIAGRVSSQLRKDEGAEVVAEQACFLPCTNDGLPVIGEIPGAHGCFVGTGHNCWGILNAPATGAALAELILEGKSTTVDLTPFSPSRFLRKHARK